MADVDAEVLAALYPLSEAGVAHLFAEGEGVVLATAGSTAGDRRRAARGLAALPGRSYSSRTTSVLFECGKAGSHYSEEPWFGRALKEAPKPKEAELDDAAERLRASRFVRPSHDRPVDVAAVRRRSRDLVLVRAAVRAAVSTDADDAEGIYRAVVLVAAIARIFSRSMVRRALSAERPWDTSAVRADSGADEWRWGAEDLEGGELERLAPRRLLDTTSCERPLPAADLLAEPAAEEEIEAVAKGVA